MGIEIRPATLADRPAICHLMNLAFDAESHGPSLSNPCESVGHSHMDPHDRADNTRILVADGQILSVVHIAERQAYACGDLLPFGFIAMVATHPDHRRRGYMRRLMADAKSYMQTRAFCYAMLFGQFRPYGGSLGWRWCGEKAPTLAWKHVVPARAARDSALCTRAAIESDIPFLSGVYEAQCANRFGPVVRSHEYWRRLCLSSAGETASACEPPVRPATAGLVTPAFMPHPSVWGWSRARKPAMKRLPEQGDRSDRAVSRPLTTRSCFTAA